MNSNIFCQECQVSFAHRASLFRHMRRKHGENPRLVYPNACSLCEKTFKNKRSLTRHITQVHANIPPTSSTLSLVRSKSLPSSTTSAVSLIQHSTHLFSPKSSGSPSNSSTQVTCHPSSIPKSPLSSKVNINSDPSTSAPLGTRPHMALLPQPSNSSRQVTFHPSPIPNCPLSLKENFTGTPSRNKRIICPFPECYLVFSRYNNFYNHFESHHNTIIDYEEVVFQTLNDFVLWKSDVEQKENSHYIQGNSGYTTSKNCKTKYYNCHRSYTYEQQNTIRTSTKNTIKTGYACPSRIACTVDGNHAVKVRFWKTHIGHTKQINKSISLDKHSKENIKDEIITGVSEDKNLNNIRDSAYKGNLSLDPTNTGFDNSILETEMLEKSNKLRSCFDNNTTDIIEQRNNVVFATDSWSSIISGLDFLRNEIFNIKDTAVQDKQSKAFARAFAEFSAVLPSFRRTQDANIQKHIATQRSKSTPK